jgi:DNA polymerase-3 subunit beta
VVPVKALRLLERNLSDDDPPVHMAIEPGTAVLLRSESAVIHSRLVEGRFPRYQDVFPADVDVKIPLDCKLLRSAVEQASIVASEESRGVDFEFCPGVLKLHSQSAEIGSSHIEIPIAYDGKAVEITFDPRYLLEALKNLEDTAVITAELTDAKNAAVFKTDDHYTYVVMPLTRERA